jgi:hypothetical protein
VRLSGYPRTRADAEFNIRYIPPMNVSGVKLRDNPSRNFHAGNSRRSGSASGAMISPKKTLEKPSLVAFDLDGTLWYISSLFIAFSC